MTLLRRLLLTVISASFMIAGCGPSPAVSMVTTTPRPPGVSVSTSTLAATFTPIPSDTVPASPTITLTPSITFTASATTTASPTLTFTPSLTPTATNTRTPYPTKVRGATATAFPSLAALTTALEPHLWFARPISEDYENFVTRTYTYGTTMNGSLPPHHGVEFYNPQGTPILAAGDGIVVFAGPDVGGAAISPQPNFYGNAVVIEHTQSINGQPVFTLYGHMSFVAVARGQAVHTGDEIGKVGGTGVALGGTHLHFEVRVGYNDYTSTRNPELWLASFPRWGTLVGRVVDNKGQLIPLVAVAVRSQSIEEETPVNRYLTTYAIETINPDSAYGENFAIMDLPPGTYTVQVGGTKTITQTIVIKPDALTFVEFRNVTPPPIWTPTATATATEKP
jgi:murein DD-endopeptidase MepM/ murein hydrolase activator NlpD